MFFCGIIEIGDFMKYDLLLKHPLKNEIYIDKIGMKIRPLNNDEKNSIYQRLDNLYFGKKAKYRLKKYMEYEKNESNHQLLNAFKYIRSKHWKNLSEEEKDANYYYKSSIEKGCTINKREINRVINSSIIVEFDDKINDYADEKLGRLIVIQIIKYLLYVNKKGKIKDINEEIITNGEFSIFTDDLLRFNSRVRNYIGDKSSKLLKEVDINLSDFEKFKHFIERLSKERIRDYFAIIDNLFHSYSTFENRIISYVSIIERLLVKHDKNYDIGKQFVLKFGLTIKEYNTEWKNDSNAYLKFCYHVRSCIVHGDDTEILDAPQKFLKFPNDVLNSLMPANNHNKKRDRVLILSLMFLENHIDIPLREWLNNTSKVEYLKNN